MGCFELAYLRIIFGLNSSHYDFPQFLVYSYPIEDYKNGFSKVGTIVRLAVVDSETAVISILIGGNAFASSRYFFCGTLFLIGIVLFKI